jgi:hypothetical protein
MVAITAAGALARHDHRPYVAVLALAGLGARLGGVAAVMVAIASGVVLFWPRSPRDEGLPTDEPETAAIACPD